MKKKLMIVLPVLLVVLGGAYKFVLAKPKEAEAKPKVDGSVYILEKEFLVNLHNAQRQTSGLVAFCVDQKLTNAARSHSQEMIDRDYFSHNSYDGTAFWVRINGFGYTGWTALAENIAWGSGTYGTPDAIFASWMNSAGHKANILNANLRQIGIGVVMGTYLTYTGARMYTADFGTR